MEDLFGNLFATENRSSKPLADRMRPEHLDDFIGQEKAVGKGSPLRRMIEKDAITSVLFYGPPGTGKTTLARVIANETGEQYEAINAVSSGVPELRKLIKKAEDDRRMGHGRTIVFIDEIHRFNKAQQDVLLPYVENGTIVLIGATTENPFFEINSPLLSRMRVVRLEKLTNEHIVQILQRAISDNDNGFASSFTCDEDVLKIIADFCQGDARGSLNILEQCEFMLPENGERRVNREILESVIGSAMQRYDKKGDQHYDIISAFIKSMRGSDVNAAMHYLARMIEGGEDLRFIARRIVICATEDVGLADPQALVIANAAAQASDFVGWPESQLIFAEAVAYICNAPKSNSTTNAIFAARQDVRAGNIGNVPKHLRDAHYPGAKALGHGLTYKYPHDYGGWCEQQYLPDELQGREYVIPTMNGDDTGRKF